MRRIKNRRKKQVKKLLFIIALIIILIISVVIFVINKNKKDEDDNKPEIDTEIEYSGITLPDTEYSGMSVNNIVMEYLENDNRTTVKMSIINSSGKKIEKTSVLANLKDSNGNVLGSLPVYIKTIENGEQQIYTIVLKGDLRSTTQIELAKQ